MSKKTKTLIGISISLISMCLFLLVYNTFMYLDIINFLQRTDIYAKINSKSFLVFFISQIWIILVTVLSLKELKKLSIGGIVLLVLGILSMFFLFFHIVALDEILDDYQHGWPYASMLKLAWHSQIFLLIFYLFSLIYFIILRNAREQNPLIKNTLVNPTFVALNILGIVCSVVGMLLILFDYAMFYHMQIKINLNRNFDFVALLPYFFVFLPYFLVFAAWQLKHFSGDKSGLDKKKQNIVTHKSAMVALWVSLPMMAGVIIFCGLNLSKEINNTPFFRTMICLGLLLFFIIMLFVFSIAGLYFNKNNRIITQ